MEYVTLVSPVMTVFEKLETTVNKYYKRGDIRDDNKVQLLRLQRQYAAAATLLRRLEHLSSPDIVNLTRLNLYEPTLQEDMDRLTEWEKSIHNARRTHRLNRMKEILDQCEATVNEFFDFAGEKISPMLEAPAPPMQPQPWQPDVYIPRNTTPPNPPRLILDYSTTATSEGQLKAAVLVEAESRIVAVIASGKGGVGKTCALRGLADDTEINNTFPGGILYIELGNDASVSSIVNGIAKIVERTGGRNLAKAIRAAESLQVAAEEASNWFRPHRCLFLVDDIWHVNGIDHNVLTILGSLLNINSRLVYTTRDTHFLNRADEVIEFLEKETYGDLSRRMLMTHAKFDSEYELDEKNQNAFDSLLEVCQGLPLAFGIVGGSVLTISRRKEEEKKEDAWSDFHCDFSSKPSVLFESSAQNYGRTHGRLSNIVDVSLQVVEKQHEREDYSKRFRSFCVVQKQQSVPDHVLQKLWNLKTLGDAQRVVSIFEEVSLVQVKRDGLTLHVRLHDLILDLAVRKASDCSESQTMFETLCRNYLPICQRNDLRYEWWNIPNDDYIYNNLCRILQSAGYVDELLWLLSKPQWITKRLVDDGIYSVEDDVKRRETIADDETAGHLSRKEHLETVRKAARMSCIIVANNPGEVWFQLHGRLLFHATKCELTRRFVEEIEQRAPRPWAKASLGILQPPGATIEIIQSPGIVTCLSVEQDKIWFVWVIYSDNLRRRVKETGVTCYESTTGACKTQHFLNDEIDDFQCFAFLRDGNSIVTGHRDLKIAIWNRETGKMKRVVTCRYKFLQKDKILLWSILRRWFVRDEETFIAFSSDGTRVVSVSSNDNVQVWGTLSGEAVAQPLVDHPRRVNCVAVSSDGHHIVTGSTQGLVHVWDGHSGEAVTHLAGHNGSVNCVSLSADGNRIVSGSDDRSVRVWDVHNGEEMAQELVSDTTEIRCVAVSADEHLIVTGSKDGTLRVWDGHSGEAVTPLLVGHNDSVNCVVLSANGNRIVSGSDDRSVRVWDVNNGKEMAQELVSDTTEIRCGAVSADGHRIVTGSKDGTLRVWDGHSGEAVTPLLVGHNDSVNCVVLSADGKRIVSGSNDKTVRVWDAHSGEAVGAPLKHGSRVRRVGVDAECSKIVSVGFHNEPEKLWDAVSGKCVRKWRHREPRVSPRGRSSQKKLREQMLIQDERMRWNSTLHSLVLSWSDPRGKQQQQQVRDDKVVLATCDASVQRLGSSDIYFSKRYGEMLRIMRD